MANLAELRQQRADIYDKMEAIYNACETEDRGFIDEEKRDFDELTNKIKDIDDRLAVAERIATCRNESLTPAQQEEEDRAAFDRGRKSRAPDAEQAITEVDRIKAFAAWCSGGEADESCHEAARRCGVNPASKTYRFAFAGRRDVETRDLTTQTTTLGGDAVPTTMLAEIERAMLAFGSVRMSGSRILTTPGGGPMELPTITDVANSGSILAENVADDETDPTFGQVTLNSYKVTSDIVNVSFEMLQDGVVDIGGLIGSLLGERLARGENALLTVGTGSSQHDGIVTSAADSGVTFASATAITYAELNSVRHSVDPSYRGLPSVAWMFPDTVLERIEVIADDQNRPLWLPSNLQEGAPGRILGYPYYINQQMLSATATKCLLFGAMEKFYIRSVRDMVLRRSDDWNFDQFQTSFVAYLRSDSDTIQANAIRYATNG